MKKATTFMLLTAFMASTTFAGIAHETDVAAFPAHAVAAKPLGQQVSHIELHAA